MKKLSLKRTALLLVLAGVLVAGMLALVGCSCSSKAPANSGGNTNGGTAVVDPSAQVTVPNLVSLTQADAEKALHAAGLEPGTITQQASDTVPAGQVISQDPAALTTVNAGTKVNLVISSGKAQPKDVKVPDLTGMSQADAEKALQEAGLVGVATKPEVSDKAKPGTVFKQSIDPGTTVQEGTKITFTIAQAPAQVLVPDVTGKSKDDAKKALTDAGLGFDFTTAYNDSVPEGQVISQSVAAGKKVNAGTTVSVVVSLGPKPAQDVKVPDVVTYSWSDAEKSLESAGLVAHYTGDPSGVVTAQDVAAGTMVAPGTIVTVTLTVPTPQVTVPDLSGMSLTEAEDATDQAGLALDYTGPDDGTVSDQSPAAGTQVDQGSTVNVTLENIQPTGNMPNPWSDADTASDAASGAGIDGGFSVPDQIYVGDLVLTSPSFQYMTDIAQAQYNASDAKLTIRKGQNLSGQDFTGDYNSYSSSWTTTVGDIEVTCHGNSDSTANLAEWTANGYSFAIMFTDDTNSDNGMSADEVADIVGGIS